ncbi:MAG: transposase IS66 family [Limisphaerales bacterium]|nr:MAG: transposase IS66 family [Limisphaerales bacterium]
MASKRNQPKTAPSSPAGGAAEFRDVDLKELRGALDRARVALSAEDYALLTGAVDTFTALTRELQLKGVTLERLRRLFLGSTSEKTKKVLGDDDRKESAPEVPPKSGVTEEKAKGHGRNGAAAYTGATREKVVHASLHGGDTCPGCVTGKVYPMKEPAMLLRVQGMAPLEATVWECDRLRCNGCGEVFTASAPAGVGTQKYDESADAMVAMLRYGAGVPFNRIERLQRGMGIPLPASTQWGLVERRVDALLPVFDALVRVAAQGEVVHNDDTSMTVLELGERTREEALAAGESEKIAGRTGVRTSGIVSVVGERKVALYFTGRQLAGESLEEVLQERLARLPPPIQMSDALSHNLPAELKTIVANCLAHGRRHFVDLVDNFPDECRKVLETLAEVYKHDDTARAQKLNAHQRLLLHQEHSGPPMKKLKTWMQGELDEHRVEPNSPLGEALRYMLKHWPALTLFLHVAGAPLDNNICERALKKAILHRKNSLFYKTVYGAQVGDLYMSLIHTAELNRIAPFPWLVALMRNADAVAKAPDAWLPWNYTASAR